MVRTSAVLRPNAAMMDKISLCTLGHLESGDPAELGELMGGLARQYPHIDMWGGCCGTWETHLDEIARNVSAARDPVPCTSGSTATLVVGERQPLLLEGFLARHAGPAVRR